LITLFTDFPEVAPLGFLHGRHGPVIDHENIDTAEPGQQIALAAVSPCQGQIAEQHCGASVEHEISVATGLLSQSARQPALAYPGWTDKEDVLVSSDPAGVVDQRAYQRAIEAAGSVVAESAADPGGDACRAAGSFDRGATGKPQGGSSPSIEPPYRWRDWASKPEGITGPELIAFINQDEAVRPDGKRGAGLFAYLRSLESTNGDRRDVIARVFQGTINRMVNGYLLRDVINRVNDIHFNSKDEIHTLGHMYETMLREMRDAAGDSGEFYTPRAVVKFIVSVVNPRLGETILDPAAGTGGFLVEAFEHLRSQAKRAQDYERLQYGTLHSIEAKPLPYLLCEMKLR
jgi:N-6 DNA Methylase